MYVGEVSGERGGRGDDGETEQRQRDRYGVAASTRTQCPVQRIRKLFGGGLNSINLRKRGKHKKMVEIPHHHVQHYGGMYNGKKVLLLNQESHTCYLLLLLSSY